MYIKQSGRKLLKLSLQEVNRVYIGLIYLHARETCFNLKSHVPAVVVYYDPTC